MLGFFGGNLEVQFSKKKEIFDENQDMPQVQGEVLRASALFFRTLRPHQQIQPGRVVM